MTQGVEKQIGAFPAVEAESHFVEVGLQMLCANFMPRSDDAALEQRERRFHCVRAYAKVGIVSNVFFRLVVDFPVLYVAHASFDHSRWIPGHFISDDHVHVGAHVILDVLRQCAGLRVRSVEESEITPALPDADYDFLLVLAELHAFALLFSADVGFIHFDNAVKHRLIYLPHCSADTMAEVPSSFVTDPECAFNLIRAHPLPRFTEEQGGEKPLLQRKMRVIEDRACSDRKLIVTSLAVKQLLRRRQFRNWTMTAQAFNSIRPAKAYKQFPALFIGIEQVYNVN